jgi:osmotically-inducible protein OsmY
LVTIVNLNLEGEHQMADYGRDYDWEREQRRYDEGRFGRGRAEERGFFNHATDEVRSWFGDEEAERRRRMDERRDERGPSREYDRPYGGRMHGGYAEPYQQSAQDYAWENRSELGRGYGYEGERGESYDSARGARGSYLSGWEQGGAGRGYGRGGETYRPEYGRKDMEFARAEQSSELGGYGYSQAYSMPYWSYTEAWIVTGPYTGRGPSGWRRSDERISEDVNESLERSDRVDATNITVSVEQGEVTLSGTVNSRLEKRLAEDLAERCAGVTNVRNNLRVVTSGQNASQTEQQTSGSQSSDAQYRTATS